MSNSKWKIVFAIYLFLILNFIVIKFNGNLPEVLDTIQSNKERREQGEKAINLVPFRTLVAYVSNSNYSIYLINLLGNIIPFIPLGFLTPLAFRSQATFTGTLMIGATVICIIEIMQVTLYLGSFDIDDLILNSISCCLGYVLYLFFNRIKKI